MDEYFPLLAIILGLSIAAPLGPIGILVIRRTLVCGKISGIATGLGAATADGIYAFIAAFGLTIIAEMLAGHILLIRILGGLFLVYLGGRIFLSLPVGDPGIAADGSLWEDYATAVLLTLTNPMTLLSFTSIFAVLDANGTSQDYCAAALVVTGIITGSVLWWLILVSGTSVFQSRCNGRNLGLINKISGSVIIVFGIIALIRVPVQGGIFP